MKRKITYLSYGHVDVTLPLIKQFFQNKIDIEFIFIFQKSSMRESILDLSSLRNCEGFIDRNNFINHIPDYIKTYLGDAINTIHFFIYPTYKLFNISSFKSSYKLFNKIKERDIIHISGAGFFLWDFYISRIRKLVITIHDYKSHKGEASNTRIAHLLEKFRLKYASHIILQNKADFKIINLQFPQSNISYVPFGQLDYLKYLPARLSKKKINFLFFGRISEYKGLEFLLQAFTKLRSKVPEATLCIAGSGYSETLKTFTASENVTVINKFLETEELVELINSSEVVVCPYIESTQSGVAITALSLLKPVIASDVGGFSDVVVNNKNGLLVKPQRSDLLADAMEKFTNKKFLEEIVIQIPDTFSQSECSWNSISTKLIDIYKTV